VADLLPQRDPGQSPFFQIKLVLQNTLQRDLSLDGLTVEELDLQAHDVELDLLINVIPQAEGYAIVYDYARQRYSAATIAQFDTLFSAALRMIVSGDQQQIGQMTDRLAQHQQDLQQDELRNLRQSQAVSRPTLGSVRRKPVSI
jgi:non-ribosomal peptide synthetase component F